jgi:hypothetical protein
LVPAGAYTLAAGIGTTAGLRRPLGLATLACLAASIAAIAFALRYLRARDTEQTASVPQGLKELTQALGGLPPPGAVFVLPYMYADYTSYWAERPVVWGGHCGDLRRFEWIAPRIRRPLPELFAELGVRYLLLDQRFASLSDLRLADRSTVVCEVDRFALYDVGGGEPRVS